MYQNFLDAYRQELIASIQAVDPADFAACVNLLLQAHREDKQVFIVGNGGSAASANHFVCDFGKNAVQDPRRRFRIISLSDNVEKITAFGNDIAFEEVFRQQLINLMNPGDLLLAVSASGNSPNLVRACEYAREKCGRIIALAGFDGGKIAKLADATIVARMQSYERIEDMHLILLHMFVCFLKEHQDLLAG
ncbi:MAG: SIS domain-containing protein [Oscillospiraceae bacterium]|jgi:D-sedoheptulose 7-phosphate isomerase|nr:SIS domain-containing protein [Oscillospiraceae bacterium]